MIRIACVLAVLGVAAMPARAEPLWLVIAASAKTPEKIASVSRAMANRDPGGLVFQNTDCGDPNRIYAWASAITTSPEAAQAALVQVRQQVSDAYVKRCNVRTGSLLAMRLPVVDPSIAEVPADAVNWQDKDRVSEARSLGGGRTLVVVRHYVPAPNDPLEGRRERIILVNATAARIVLSEDCVGAAHVTEAPGRVAFDCVREQAGDQLLHVTLAFDDSGRKLAAIDRCRTPRWANAQTLVCSIESVDAAGRLQLTARRTEVAK